MGPVVADFGESIGFHLDPEERLALDVMLAEREDGTWAAFEAAIIACRQNLKTFVLRLSVLGDLYLFDADLVIWTAHLFPTAMEAFRDIKQSIETHPFLSRRVKKITEANGEEGIELMSGQRLLFKARSKTGGRGLTGDVVVLDEAFALSGSEMGSLLPTLSARPNPQVRYGSSAGLVGSQVLRGVRNRGRAGGDPSLAYVEWCAPVTACRSERCEHQIGTRGCALDDEDLWQRANPALGKRLAVERIRAERRAMPPEEFVRERLGWWDEPASSQAAGLPLEAWAGCLVEGALPASTAALAVDVTPDFSWSSIARADDDGVIEIVARRRGTAWVREELSELVGSSRVTTVVDFGGPASVLKDDLEDLGVPLLVLSGKEVAQACAAFVDAVVRHAVTHRGQPELDAAVEGASRRPLGDAWAWSRKSSAVDISPLVAVTFARVGARQKEAAVAPMVAWR
jgi:hypothetical protein